MHYKEDDATRRARIKALWTDDKPEEETEQEVQARIPAERPAIGCWITLAIVCGIPAAILGGMMGAGSSFRADWLNWTITLMPLFLWELLCASQLVLKGPPVLRAVICVALALLLTAVIAGTMLTIIAAGCRAMMGGTAVTH